MKELNLIFDNNTIEEYNQEYFLGHPRATTKPIKHPYHESINVWMIMKRPMMNALKQRWKQFIAWFIEREGFKDTKIEKCTLAFKVFYPTNRRHDVDNITPKFIIDGLVESGLIEDDDSEHITKLTLECGIDANRPRTEMKINIL